MLSFVRNFRVLLRISIICPFQMLNTNQQRKSREKNSSQMQAMTFTIIPFCSLPLTQSPMPRLFIASFLMTIKLIRKLSSMVVVVSTAHFFFGKLHVPNPALHTQHLWAMQLNANCRFCYATAAKVGSKCTLIKESSSMINFSFLPY